MLTFFSSYTTNMSFRYMLYAINSMHAASQDFVDLKDLCSVRFFNFLEEMFHRSYIHGDVQRFELFQRKTLYKYLYYY